MIERPAAVAAGAGFGLSLMLYAATLAPTVGLIDSGELTVAAATLGVAHPPGFPLYLLLTHPLMLLPFGSPAQRANLASAVYGAAAVAVLVLVAYEVLRGMTEPAAAATRPQPRGGRARRRGAAGRGLVVAESSAEVVPGGRLALAALGTGLLFGVSRTLWSFATVAEVYTLNTLLVLATMLAVLLWRRAILAGVEPTRANRLLCVAGLLMGLALGVHHVTVALTLPGLAALVWLTRGPALLRSRALPGAAVCGVAGLLVYGYLPLAAARAEGLNWGDPRTLERFWWHVSGRQYQSNLSLAPGDVVVQAGRFLATAGREFGPWWLPPVPLLALVGAGWLYRRARAIIWLLGLLVVGNLVYVLGYDIAEDKDAYYLVTFAAVAVAVGGGIECLAERLHGGRRGASRTWAMAALTVVVPAAVLVANWPYANRAGYSVAREYVDDLLSGVESGGMLLTQDWQVSSPLLYFQSLERRRDDVVAVNVNLLRRSWYLDYLWRRYPGLLAATEDRVAAYLEDLRAWERDPAVYQRDLALNRRISARFNELVLGLIGAHARAGPVYVTAEMALGREPELQRVLGASYALVPRGLVAQLTPERGFREPLAPPPLPKSIADGSVRFEADDVVQQKVLPTYPNMLLLHGRYLAEHGRHAEAVQSFERALAVDPRFVPAQRALAESRRALGGPPR